jgi:hypothetical protein
MRGITYGLRITTVRCSTRRKTEFSRVGKATAVAAENQIIEESQILARGGPDESQARHSRRAIQAATHDAARLVGRRHNPPFGRWLTSAGVAQLWLALKAGNEHPPSILRGGKTVSDFIAQHAAELWSFLTGLIGGGAAGSLVTYRVTRSNRASGRASIVDQSGSAAGGDIVARDKNSTR